MGLTCTYLPRLKEELPPFSFSLLFPFPSWGGREDTENQVPCRLMKTRCSNPKKQVILSSGLFGKRGVPFGVIHVHGLAQQVC